MIALLAAIALVSEERVALRAAPREGATAEALLSRGDWLEVRGEAPGFLKVYDHRRERPGYVRADKVRVAPEDEAELRAIVRFLRGAPGMEALGLGYAALALRAANATAKPGAAQGGRLREGVPVEPGVAELYAAIGEFASRIAARGGPQREVAEAAGAKFIDLEREGRVVSCYDGDAFRRVLALPGADGGDRARAALALTAVDCVDPAAAPAAAKLWNEWRVEVLDRVQSAPAQLLARVRLRRVEALGALAYGEGRNGNAAAAAERAGRAMRELQLVDRATLAEEEQPLYSAGALQLSAVRWAMERPAPAPAKGAHLTLERGARPGETCLRVVGEGRVQLRRCTWGQVWEGSLRRGPGALTAAVQLGPAWTELWVFHQARHCGAQGASCWTQDVIPPASSEPEIGYVEWAGSSPDGARLSIVREAMVRGRLLRQFQLLSSRSLRVIAKSNNAPQWLGRMASPSWREQTLALR